MAGLELEGIQEKFGDLAVLKDSNLVVADSEFLTLVGPSGCGKSTLLRIVAGLEAQTAGDVKIDGIAVNQMRPSRRDLAMVFQSYALYPHLTVKQTLKIEHLPDREPGQLSGGQRQRVAAVLVSSSNDPKQIEAAWTFLKFTTSGVGATAVAETTEYMPPNKAANDLLADFYEKNTNKQTAVRQAGLLSDWIAHPGDNGLAITQVIYDGLEAIVTGESDDMEVLQQEMAEEVSSMLLN